MIIESARAASLGNQVQGLFAPDVINNTFKHAHWDYDGCDLNLLQGLRHSHDHWGPGQKQSQH